SEFTRAREALAPFTAAPTQRVAMLMAEIERTEHGDSGRARAWTLRAVRALHDPVWTADGYVSDKWRPVSPVSGRLDAFQWQTPVAALPSDKAAELDAKEFNEAIMTAPRRVEPPREAPVEVEAPAEQDNSPAGPVIIEAAEPAPSPAPAPSSPPAGTPATAAPPPESSTMTAAPLFRARADLGKARSAPIPAIIPIVRAPDDPGLDDEPPPRDEFAEQLSPSQGQAGGWRGFLSRWGA
ncbi:MAG: hypothetical protein WCA28_16945, partial [Bradyrhizobium sp.]